MLHTPSPFNPPSLRPDRPTYPIQVQALRVTGGTIPGPSGYMSSSVLGPSLYLAYTQQLDPVSLRPRDREPCLALDLNRYGLAPGYYTNCRLVSNHNGLPVYEIGGAPVSPATAFSWITPAQTIMLQELTPAQIAVLNNLTPCQLDVLLTSIPISQIHTLTLELTPTELTNLINFTNSSEFTAIYNQLDLSQILTLVTNLNQEEMWTIFQALTPEQILSLVTNLTVTQIQELTTISPADLDHIFSELTILQIQTALNSLTTAQIETLLSLTGAQIVALISSLSTADLGSFLSVDAPLPTLIPSTGNTYTGSISSGATTLPAGTFILSPTISGATTITSVAVVGSQFLIITNPVGNANNLTIDTVAPGDLDESEFTVLDAEDVVLAPGEAAFFIRDPATGGFIGTTTTGGGSGSVSLTNGTAALGSPYTVTTSYASTGLSVSLPSSGTYLLLCNVFSSIDGSQHEKSNFRLYNSTDAAAVGPVGIHELAATTAAQAQGCSVTLHAIVTVAASKTIQLQAITDTTGTAEVAATETTLSYVKIA